MRCCVSIAGLVMLFTAAASGQACLGDCNSDGRVTVDEIITALGCATRIAFPDVAFILGCPECPNVDASGDGTVTVDELVTTINNALGGCPRATLTPTPAPTVFGGCIKALDPDEPTGCNFGTSAHHCFSPAGGSGCFGVIAPDDCCWEATGYVEVAGAGCGDGTVCYVAPPAYSPYTHAAYPISVGHREFLIGVRRRYTITPTRSRTPTPTSSIKALFTVTPTPGAQDPR